MIREEASRTRRARNGWLARLLLAAGLTLSGSAHAAKVQLAWDANTERYLSGYKLYYDTDGPGLPYDGKDANEGPSPIRIPINRMDDPGNPSFTITGLSSCREYHFAVTAYSDVDGGAESGLSNMVHTTVIASPNPVTLTSASPTSLAVTWSTLPDDDHGTMPQYRIFYDTHTAPPYQAPGSPLDVVLGNQPDPGRALAHIENLTPNTAYFVVVEASCPGHGELRSSEVSGVVGQHISDGGVADAARRTEAMVSGGGSSGLSPSGASGDGGGGCAMVPRSAPSDGLLVVPLAFPLIRGARTLRRRRR